MALRLNLQRYETSSTYQNKCYYICILLILYNNKFLFSNTNFPPLVTAITGCQESLFGEMHRTSIPVGSV